jgi:GDP-4-dehydro-6-deoxy-D-mannose reductase
MEDLLRRVQPAGIFHLAGYANAGRSFREPDLAWEGNFTATRSLYDAIVRWGGKPRMVYVGSGLIYGEPESAAQRLSESDPLCPTSPYATSKAAADLLSYQVTRSAGLHVVRARPFNHTGPRQAPDYAVPNFAKQIADIERGKQPPVLETGNLNALRDLSDVRDVVHAYTLLLEHGRAGEAYNIASGQARPMQFVLEYLLSLARVRIEVRQRPDPSRTAEPTAVCGDPSKLRRDTGWAPRFSIEQTLADTLEYWRSQS